VQSLYEWQDWFVSWLYTLDSSFISWLHEWQDLVAGLVGAAALIATVRWTLLTERRRRADEARALRVALGAEIRQFTAKAWKGFTEVYSDLRKATPAAVIAISAHELEGTALFPEAVVYPQTAASLGLLGAYAYRVVHFYAQLSLVRDLIRRAAQAPDSHTPCQWNYVLNFADGLLKTTEAAMKTLPAFEMTAEDTKIAQLVAQARPPFESFKAATWHD
jgi:hypothetical protein